MQDFHLCIAGWRLAKILFLQKLTDFRIFPIYADKPDK